MTEAMVHVWEKAEEKTCSLRTAAYIVACERIRWPVKIAGSTQVNAKR
jgi:glutamate dehydrogenase/leucine dehydrogenase